MTTSASNRARVGLVAAVALTLLTSCGSSTPKLSATALLQKARGVVNASSGAHFVLTSTGVGTKGTNITGGEGDLIRPDELQGSFQVTVDGFVASVKVASIGNVFEALTPFASHYVVTNPASYGLTNPAELLDPVHGLTSLLTAAVDPQSGPSERINGELLDTVDFTVPGTDIPVLPDAAPSQPVAMVAAIDPSSYQLREVTLTGPLITATSNSTFTLVLTQYGEHVKITLPPTS
jgi:hypothetical protein